MVALLAQANRSRSLTPPLMSALGQKQTFAVQTGTSALPPKATLNATYGMSALGRSGHLQRKTACPLYPGSALHLDTLVFFWMHLSSAISRKARLRIIRTSDIIRMTTPQSAERGQSSPDG